MIFILANEKMGKGKDLDLYIHLMAVFIRDIEIMIYLTGLDEK